MLAMLLAAALSSAPAAHVEDAILTAIFATQGACSERETISKWLEEQDATRALWDGTLWTKEYPDSVLLNSKSEARRIANILSHKLEETVWIVKNYGLDNEETTKIVCY